MTLCVAWKNERKIYFASDSCVSVGSKHMPYNGIKVLEIPVHIRSANDKLEGSRILYNQTFGFAFAGSFLGAYLLKESITESLKNLQTIRDESISLDKIAIFIFNIYKYFFNKLQENFEGHDLDFLLAGYCPFKKQLRAYKYFIDFDSENPKFIEILIEDTFCWESIGSGESQFNELMESYLKEDKANKVFSAPKCLRLLIKKKEIPSVDGTIQLGFFHEDMNFRLSGVQDYDGDDVKLYIRGTNIEQIQGNDLDGFYVCYRYSLPFEEEINHELL